MRNLKNSVIDGRYVDMSQDEFKEELTNILYYWERFIEQYNEQLQETEKLEINKDYFINHENLREVIKRVDKREVYYYIFHNMSEVCEYKHIAITSYWLCALKPFIFIKDHPLLTELHNSVNERFSFYLILSTLRGVFERIYPYKKFEYPSDIAKKDIIYNFKYCDLSREAFIFFVETFAKSYGIGLDVLDILEKDLSNATI